MPKESPMTRSGREALIVEALRTPMGKSHPERGWYREVHPNEMLGAVYTALLDRTGLAPEAAYRRLHGFLLRRGYPPDLAREAARRALAGLQDQEFADP